ncbi:polyprotein [Plakobranchus ocellatus]|uniref:Polyprotein n=1 Tax=Plakobranchus ocellatus TaxID=259542 RepID=A0AAV4D8P9_9GAST|nr:polyprotein [Plakobranchus ocellatus]
MATLKVLNLSTGVKIHSLLRQGLAPLCASQQARTNYVCKTALPVTQVWNFEDREELETHLRKTYSDPTHEIPLEEITGLVWPAAPGIKFDSKPPNLQEVIAVVNKARAKSAPGPKGVSYLVYKRCSDVLKKLHKILRSAWKNIKISKEWMTAEGVYIPKEQDSKGINQFRPISLFNVKGKIFFSIMASRLTKYRTENGYINTSFQKGGIPGVLGCWNMQQ